MSRKSQMEILGLALVFVIIITGFLLYLKFSNGSEITTKEEYLLPVKSQSILTAMLRTDVLCCQNIHCTDDNTISYSISDLLKDGADINLNQIKCYSSSDNDFIDSEVYAQEQMDLLLADTMEIWQEDYWYKAVVDNSPVISGNGPDSNNGCNEDSKQRDTGFHAIELRTDTLEITFGICT